MALVVPGVGEVKLLNYYVNKGLVPENLVLKLFMAGGVPAQSATTATFTEATGNGYPAGPPAGITLVAANWTLTQGDPSDATAAQQTFTFTGAAGFVHGYFVVGVTDNVLRWGELFVDGPYNVVNNGDQIKVTLRITAQ